MTNLRNHTKAYREAGSLAELVPIRSVLNPQTLLTKRGDLIRAYKMTSSDSEGLDPETLANHGRIFTEASRQLGTSITVYEVAIRRAGSSVPREDATAHPVLQRLTRNRAALFARKAQELYTTDAYIVLCAQGQWASSQSRWLDRLGISRRGFSRELTVNALGRRLLDEAARFEERASAFASVLAGAIDLQPLDAQEASRLYRRMLNFKAEKADVALARDESLNYQVCGSTLECHADHLVLDEHKVRVLSLKQPPASTFANMLSALTELKANAIVVTQWRAHDPQSARRFIQSLRRHFHNSKASFLNYTGSSAPAAHDVLIDDSASAMVDELGTCLSEMELGRETLGHASLTIILHDEDAGRLREAVGACLTIFGRLGGQLVEETYNALNAFLAALPGNQAFNLRQLWMTAANHADLSFLFTSNTGGLRDEHLGQEYLAALETNAGMPFFFGLHLQDVAHTLILGATGSGKSFLLCFFLTHAQKYTPLTFIFDLGGSYKTNTELLGGSYLTIANAAISGGASEGQTRKLPFSINPFASELTPAHHQFLHIFVRTLIEESGRKLTSAEEKDVYEQIENLYEIEPSQRRLGTLANMLGRTLRDALQKWVVGGPYAAVFDNEIDTLSFARFQTFDFEGFEKSPVLEPLLFYLFHRVNLVICSEAEATTFKIFAMDEAWRFFKHPAIRAYAAEAIKTWRKKNAAVIMATQSTEDLLASDMLDIVVESCPTKVFLANPGMNREIYRRVFQLSETEADLIAGLQPKRQLLLKRPGLAKVLNLEVDPETYWLYTSDPFDNEKRRKAFEHGFEKGLQILTTTQRSHP
jgi:type IV secretion system protein TrbE